jgi:predicted transcriptional regulator
LKRTQIYLEEDLDHELRELAAAEGRSAAAVIREAVRGYLQGQRQTETDDPIQALIGAFDGGRTDGALHHDKYLYGRDD